MKIKEQLLEQAKTLSVDPSESLTEFNQLFESVDVTDESKNKLSTLYESAVKTAAVELAEAHINKIGDLADSKVAEEKQTLSEAYTEYQKFYEKDLNEKLDLYLERVSDEYMSENEVAIDLGMRAALYESLMSGLKNLLNENNVELPEDKIDVVKELTENVSEVTEKYDQVSIKLKEQINENRELKRDKTVMNIFEQYQDLTDTQKEKIQSLSESLEMNDQFEDKFKTLVEAVSDKQATGGNKPTMLEENNPEFNPESDNNKKPTAKPMITEQMDPVAGYFA